MHLKSILLRNFGPFRKYEIQFPEEDQVCALLTGKNNEGKSCIIRALKLLNAATKVVGRNRQIININGDERYRLLQADLDSVVVGRLVHNYQETIAEIRGTFSNGIRVEVFLDPMQDIVYADHIGQVPKELRESIGFIPPLGPVAEFEEPLTERYLRSVVDTSLAPRHIRNHFQFILNEDEFELIRDIVSNTWSNITLLRCEYDATQNHLNTFYKEDRWEREIAWAGQGLQVWFQIVSHLVRLRDKPLLVFDEPEVNLHPEKQNDLVSLVREYCLGSAIIATHSVELMNNVSVSHIVHVEKSKSKPKPKSTDDRTHLEIVRSSIGSNFNLIASQFDDVDALVFTEDTQDFKTVVAFASRLRINARLFNIPSHGFSGYKKVPFYKDAYNLLIGRETDCRVLLDRDFYPVDYLESVQNEMEKQNIQVLFTPGKEIENCFLSPKVIDQIIPKNERNKFDTFWDEVYEGLYYDCHGSFLKLHQEFLPSKLDIKTVATKYGPQFDKKWQSHESRHLLVSGKAALQKLRKFYRDTTGSNLSLKLLLDGVEQSGDSDLSLITKFIFGN